MTDKLKSLFNSPYMLISAMGIAFVLLANSARRLYVEDHFFPTAPMWLSTIPVVLVLVILAWFLFHHKADHLFSSRSVIIALSLVSLIVFYLMFTPRNAPSQTSSALIFTFNALYKLCCGVIMLFWINRLKSYRVEELFTITGIALVLLACLEAVASMLAERFFQLFIATSGATSCLFLLIRPANPPKKKTLIELSSTKGKWLSLLMGASLIFVCSLAFGPLQSLAVSSVQLDEAGLTLMRFSGAFGTLLAGATFLLFTRRPSEEYYRIAYVQIIMLYLAYIVSLFVGGVGITLLCIPLFLAQRLSIAFFIFTLLSVYPHEESAFALLFAVYKAAQTLGSIQYSLAGTQAGNLSLALLTTETMILFVLGLLFGQSWRTWSEFNAALPAYSPDIFPKDADGSVIDSMSSNQTLFPKAIERLATHYGLSSREQEIVRYLAQGMRAGEIAEVLILSQATVKNHISHIYRKLGIHAQHELLLMINQESSAIYQNMLSSEEKRH